jgi:predicted negative regulator of RcsB-dependent stress response
MRQRVIVEIDADSPDDAIRNIEMLIKYSQYGSTLLLKKEIENGNATSTAQSLKTNIERRRDYDNSEETKCRISRICDERSIISSTKIIRGDNFNG